MWDVLKLIYGCKCVFLRIDFWINEEFGSVFCLRLSWWFVGYEMRVCN